MIFLGLLVLSKKTMPYTIEDIINARQPCGYFWRTALTNGKVTVIFLGKRDGVPSYVSMADFKTVFEVSVFDDTVKNVTGQYLDTDDDVMLLTAEATVQLANRLL